ncbi:hypothetical protein F4802DRAFT_587765 [Xylaria palmicola]|nr:hypothetical protein F4802DRAFT_587765 [Xylaria palmicola]
MTVALTPATGKLAGSKRHLGVLELGNAKQSRFSRGLAKNLEAQKQRSLLNTESLKSQLLPDRRIVAPKTQRQRDQLTEAWHEFFTQVHGIDPDSIWVDICEGRDVSWLVRDFFIAYLENSKRDRPCLGPEEYITVQSIKSATTPDSMWNTLVRAADTGFLQKKRIEDPGNERKWTLSRVAAGRGCSHSTITKIDLWIAQELPDFFHLNREQSYKKTEMTANDVMVLLVTLWTQARHIPCEPLTRVSFHTAVLMAAIGGFRPGELLPLKYNQVRFELVQDPKDPSQTRLVVSIQIRHSKVAANTIQRTQHKTLSFCITTIPCKPLCLVRLLVGKALANGAFETNFETIDDILKRPHLGEAQSLPLHWKKDMEDKAIIPISYAAYLTVWSRTLIVAGLREAGQRPYSLRVGAGGRLSGSLTEPVRNYVLGNSEDVYLKSYQPHRVSHNLVEIAFGDRAAGDNAALFQSLRDSLLQRDPNAPIYITEQDVLAFEQRQDMSDLRNAYRNTVEQTSSCSPQAKRIAAKIAWVKGALTQGRLLQLRKAYFEETDKLRAMGEARPRASDHGLSHRKSFDPQGAAAAESIGKFIQLNSVEDTAPSLETLYARLLRRCPTDVLAPLEKYLAEPQKDKVPLPGNRLIDPERRYVCLFGCESYVRRASLTKHNTHHHFDKGDFDRPFPCPECRRLGHETHVIDGPVQWCNHAETYHGREYTPNLPANLNSRPGASWAKNMPCPQPSAGPKGQCLICNDVFKNAGAFSTHFKIQHIEKQKLFESPFDCPVCVRQKTNAPRLDGPTDWLAHVESAHQGGGVYGRLHSLRAPRKKRGQASPPKVPISQGGRCLVCNEMFKNAGAFTNHFRLYHIEERGFFRTAFDCPECVRQQTKPPRFDNATDWQVHLKEDHQGGGLYGYLHSPSLRSSKKRSQTELPDSYAQGDPAIGRPRHKKIRVTEENHDAKLDCIIGQSAPRAPSLSSDHSLDFIDPQLFTNCAFAPLS